MKTSKDFSIASLLKGAALSALGALSLFSCIYIGSNGGNQVICSVLIIGGLIAIGFGGWIIRRNFDRI